MLFVIPAHNLDPWDYIYQNMLDEIPAGKTYFQTLEMLPRSIKPQEILIFTDQFIETKIILNNKVIYNFIPNSQVTRLKIRTLVPPATNNFTITNGFDEPARLQLSTTHQAAHYQVLSRELYNFSGYIAEKYWSAMQSPWATFFIEYQLPWKELLPDLREMRILSIKMAVNALYNGFGTQGAVEDFLTAFAVSTPAILPAKNHFDFRPDLWNPVRSGDDISGFKAHLWFPNICLNRWTAFIRYINNVDAYAFARPFSEEIVTIRNIENGRYEQHFFETTDRQCSILGLLDYLGCLDSLTASCSVHLESSPAFCFFANPFDMTVEVPGIGGGHFDSGKTFDGEYGPFDTLYDIDALTDYWVGASTMNRFDSGGCLDSYLGAATFPTNTDCCSEGPNTKLFHTTVVEDEVPSATTPNHPIFGGDDPGLLNNPYFAIPYTS